MDAARERRLIPWRAYLPKNSGPAPAVIFSHGGGGTRESGKLYGELLANNGIAALHLQHLGSDRMALIQNPQQISEMARNPELGRPRFEDVGFAYRQLKEGRAVFASRVDGERVGMSGHSLGAITTQIIAGQSVTGFGQDLALRDLKGAIAYSPSPPRAGYGDAETAFTEMFMPMMHMTGTADEAPNEDFEPPARRIPFDRTSNVDQYLLILDDGRHSTFSGEENPALGGRYPGIERHHERILAATLAFWSWILKGDGSARATFDCGDFQAGLIEADKFESKRAGVS